MRKSKHSLIFNIVVTMFVFLCVMSIVKLQIEINRQNVENEAVRNENQQIQYDIDEYRNDLNTPKDEAYYEKKAREKLNLRLPEEIIFYNDLIN